jgi:polysaccharide pyruvyl transferase WcaK-like protein
MRIIIYGAYGSGNFGDEATLDVLIEHLEKVPGDDLLVFSSDPQETSALYSVKARRPSLVALVQTDAIIIEDLDTSFKFLVGFLARVLRKQILYYAVGFPNLTLPMKLLMPLAIYGKKLYVRDTYSKEAFERFGLRDIQLVPDPALRLEPVEKSRAKRILEKQGIDLGRFLVGLSLRYSQTTKLDERVKKTMVYVINWLIKEKNAEIVFVPMCKHKRANADKDHLFGEDLRQLVEEKEHFKVLNELSSPREAKGVIGLMSLCIGMRLHSAVFAYSLGIPYVGLVTGRIGYDEKIVSFMKSHFRKAPLNIGQIDAQLLKHRIMEALGNSEISLTK